VIERWNRFWFRPASPHALIAARFLLAFNALWIVLSRPALPDLVRWPAIFWSDASLYTRIRFLIVPFPYGVEFALYALSVVALLFVAAGKFVRPAAFASAVLLYHFADFEKIFSSSGSPFFRGLALPVSGLLIIAFAKVPRASDESSPEYRWPLVLIQLLFAMTYLMSGIAKLRLVGISWFRPANFTGIVLAKMIPDAIPPWAQYVVDHPPLIALCAAGGIAIDFFTITAVFSRRAARIIVPITFIGHVLIMRILDVFFLNLPLLLLFVNWEWLFGARRERRGGSARAAEPGNAPAGTP
jgi:hypothetical protein